VSGGAFPVGAALVHLARDFVELCRCEQARDRGQQLAVFEMGVGEAGVVQPAGDDEHRGTLLDGRLGSQRLHCIVELSE
jgi:hypothetical protein